jgi:Na+/proline symporter
VIRDFVPVGLAGLLIAGLLAAFMSTFSGTINAAAAYLVNDVYKRYLVPEADHRQYIRVSYAASLAVVVVGCAAGYYTPSVAKAVDWIVSGLWGGYAAANILKWYWWRLNGFGYFAGMMTGIAGALAMLFVPGLKEQAAEPLVYLISLTHDGAPTTVNVDLMAFPTLLVVSLIGTFVGTYVTRPEPEDVLVDFYTRTRPWGWWGPIRAAAMRRDPNFVPNRNFGWDAFNVLIGIVWQTSFVALPIYVVIQHWTGVATCTAIILTTSAILKHTWYDRLEAY